MTKMLRLALLLGVAATFAHAAASADDPPKTGFVDYIFKDKDGTQSKYVVFVPHSYKADKDFPCILFLHGSGESGDDGQKQVKTGLGPAIKKHEKTFPFITVFPQSQKKTWGANSADGKRALAILEEVKKNYKVDGKRVYLTGLSMGGFGTWSQATAHPDMWAAIVPICGGGNPKDAEKIKNIPCWCVHGDADKSVSVDRSREMIKALKAAGASLRYDELPGVPHNSWDAAYGKAELYTWLLEQSKK